MAAIAAPASASFIDVGPDQVLARLVTRNVEGAHGDLRSRSTMSLRLSGGALARRARRALRAGHRRARAARSPSASCPTTRSARRSASTTTGSCGAPGSASAATRDRDAPLAELAGAGRARCARRRRRSTGEQIDLVLVASCSQDSVMPNAAPQVAHALGAHAAGAFDIGSACTGFVAALAAARGMLAQRRLAPRARDRARRSCRATSIPPIATPPRSSATAPGRSS